MRKPHRPESFCASSVHAGVSSHCRVGGVASLARLWITQMFRSYDSPEHLHSAADNRSKLWANSVLEEQGGTYLTHRYYSTPFKSVRSSGRVLGPAKGARATANSAHFL